MMNAGLLAHGPPRRRPSTSRWMYVGPTEATAWLSVRCLASFTQQSQGYTAGMV